MPKVLFVAATKGEIAPLLDEFDFYPYPDGYFEAGSASVGILVTGIGMVNTAWALGRFLLRYPVQLAVNIGIAGSFDKSLKLGEVVEITEDIFSEMGAESKEGFLDLAQMGFAQMDQAGEKVFNILQNPQPWNQGPKLVRGITVNTVHGRADTIASVESQWSPQVESMEGAAFFLAMKKARIPAYAFRSLSNYVEVRNREAWNIPLAIRSLSRFVARDFLPGQLF